jgi:sugar phosphate isomerase/epimerase
VTNDLSGRLGIFARTFRRDTPKEVAAQVAAAGYALAHWNFTAIGLPALAHGVDDTTFVKVRAAFDALGIGIPSVSATYNMLHPDPDLRAAGTQQAVELIRRVEHLGAHVVTLCTGTRDPDDMWTAHPDNSAPSAWCDLLTALDTLMPAAAEAGVMLGIEPEPGNIVRDAATAARLLDKIGHDAPVGIVFDPANLISPSTITRQAEILGEAVTLLGDRIFSAHAKDVVTSGRYSAAGAGLMDYQLVLDLLERITPVPLIVQDATEDEARRVRTDLLRWHADLGRQA